MEGNPEPVIDSDHSDPEEENVQEEEEFIDETDSEEEMADMVVPFEFGIGNRSASVSSEEDDFVENPNHEAGRIDYDRDLPLRHSYLGESSEVRGRTILDEDCIQELVIFTHQGLALMPGQTMPLTLFRDNEISAIKNVIESNKTFGFLCEHPRMDVDRRRKLSDIGTTAEIYEYRESDGTGLEVGFKIKVKGRQRFRVVSKRTQIDGTQVAKVIILNEKDLGEPLFHVRLKGRDKLRILMDENEKESSTFSDPVQEKSKRSHSFRESLSGLLSKIKSSQPPKKDKAAGEENPARSSFVNSNRNYWRTNVYRAPLTPFPSWVYEQYDKSVLVDRVHSSLEKLHLYSGRHAVSVPNDAVNLSYWLSTNLPMTDGNRMLLLSMDSCVQRLRFLLGILERSQRLCCHVCSRQLAHVEDIFSMSHEGTQIAYVNPGGHVHETLTLTKASNIKLYGEPSSQHSWFPGYEWTIANCKTCDNHLGWRFTAVNRQLNPRKFWGLSRRSIIAYSDILADESSHEEISRLVM